jgi:uncharacterized membrane protein
LSRRGQSTLYAILLMPVLLTVLAVVADVGSLQVQRVRLSWAQDMALVDAVTEVDPAFYATTGKLRLDAGAEAVYRSYLSMNLLPLRGMMANGLTPDAAAAQADVAIVNATPAVNPFSGHRLDRPAICARVRVRFRTGLLGLAGVTSMQTLTATGEAQIREDSR